MNTQHNKLNSYPKEKTPRSQEYKDWLKTQRCCICGTISHEWVSVVPAHQTIDGHGYMSGKSNDFYAIPLCSRCHLFEHQGGAKSFWKGRDKIKLVIDHLIKFIQRDEDAR